jgi:hypothetical protein
MTKIDKIRAALLYYCKPHDRPNEGPWGINSTDFGKVAAEALSELDGMVLVPMEPTREMIKSAWTAQYLNIGADMAMAENLAEIRVNDTKQKSQDQLAYEAMIAPYVGEKK